MRIHQFSLAAALALLPLSPAAQADVSWPAVAQALGKSGTELPGGVYRVGLARTDLHVTMDGVPLLPAFALGSWLAFKTTGSQAMVMGDLVLTGTEVASVMSRLAAGGIEVTALHNHLLRGSPMTFYMHVLGHGDPVKLAEALHAGLIESGTPLGVPPIGAAPVAAAAPPTIELDTAMIDRTLGAKGKINGGVYQVSLPRAETVVDGGMDVPASMGSAEAINFQPSGGGKAAITGDFVLTAAEVNPVLRVLREHGIEITALHNHMLDDQPRLFFMHFWANDDTVKLATGLRAALDKINLAPR